MALAATGLVSTIFGIGGKIIDGIWPDKTKADEFKHQFAIALMDKESELSKAAASIVQAEASSSHWLAANWRPIVMLGFFGLICARMFGYTAPGITEAEYIKLWGILELGIGGYVIGRSVEKSIGPIGNIITKLKSKE